MNTLKIHLLENLRILIKMFKLLNVSKKNRSKLNQIINFPGKKIMDGKQISLLIESSNI